MTFALPHRPQDMPGSMPVAAAPCPNRYVFLLLDQFTHLAFACALEPLRLANHLRGHAHYGWQTLSVDGSPVRASNGVMVQVDGGLGPLGNRDTLVVVGGLTPRGGPSPRLAAFLRREQAHGRRIIGICGATAVLAAAGILQDQSCAVHWEVSDAFAELHPEVRIVEGPFTLDSVPTAAGGAAAGDLVLHLIGTDLGREVAGQVADLMIFPGLRDAQAPQTASRQTRPGMRTPALAAALKLMERHLDAPLPMPEIARRSGASVRQIERLFLRHLKTSPNRHYMALRLTRARRLLTQTGMAVTEVALACGFTSPSHFCKTYRAHFGRAATADRTAPRP